MTTVARVTLWGETVGAVSVEGPEAVAAFEYTPAFRRRALEISPLTMPLSPRIYEFPGLPAHAFRGLPGMLADALPDAFGNAVLDAWLATQGRTADNVDVVERLCYTGTRGMGALEFHPSLGPPRDESSPVSVAALVDLAAQVLRHRDGLHASFADDHRGSAMREILRVGASAGGARAKAVIAWNPLTHEVRSGQVQAPQGFEHWLLKFDGVESNRDRELADPAGYGAVEYVYHLLATRAGITMCPCRLLEESGRRHFMTRRFDRTADGGKLHLQSLAALAHLDFRAAGAHGYEQALLVVRRLGLGMDEIEELYRRMVFNIVARNQDDHVKNIAFLMAPDGTWSLSPAFDVAYSYNPRGAWTALHQMSIGGKRDGFLREDLRHFADTASMARGRADEILDEVLAAVLGWPEEAAAQGVSDARVEAIRATHRLDW